MPNVTFPPAAFRQNIMDYTREVWNTGVDACFWRELLQNARDARATRVDIEIENAGTMTIVKFKDNGCGMTREVLVNGLLTYAGSVKPTGAAGGFGMAKCLLVFAPNNVVIETNELAVTVTGISYDWLDVSEPINGTRYTVTIDNDGFEPEKQITPTVEGLKFLMARCDMGSLRVYCNGERIYDTKLPEDAVAVRQWEDYKAFAYHLPRSRPLLNRAGEPVMIIQHRGIWIMDMVISSEVKGCVWVNINEEPRKVLNAACVSLASYDLRSCIDTFLRDIARSPKQTLKTKKYVKRFDGEMTRISNAKEVAQSLSREVLNAGAERSGRSVKLAAIDQQNLLEEIAKLAFEASGGDDGYRLKAASLDPARLNITADDDSLEVADKIAALVWAPAMMVVNEKEEAVPKQYMPETMGKKAKQLLTVWSEMVKQFLILTKAYGCTFGVGFIFSDDTLAQWRKEDDGTVWFLMNPVDKDGLMRFSLSNSDDRSVMISEAGHEVCHQIITNSWHGDEYAVALTDVFALALTHSQLFNNIWKMRPID